MGNILVLLVLAIGLQACGMELQIEDTPSEPMSYPNYQLPVWGPSNLIVFRPNLTDEHASGLWSIRPDGRGQQLLLLHEDGDNFDRVDWSPDGQWLALTNRGQIYRIRSAGGERIQLTFGLPSKASPSWSSDGQWIAFSAGDGLDIERSIWMVAADGHEVKQIRNINGFSLDWSLSGKIVFVAKQSVGAQPPTLMIMDSTGDNLTVVFDPTQFEGHDIDPHFVHPQFSPDGTGVAFETWWLADLRNPQIWVVNVDGSHPRKLTDRGVEPSWSPDGRWIVYVKSSWNRSKAFQPASSTLWIMDADGHNQRQLTY